MVDGSGQVKGKFRTSAMSDHTDKSAQSTQLLDEEALVAAAYMAISLETAE